MADKIDVKKLVDFCAEVALLKEKAGSLGLYKTMQALDAGVQKVGWEVAEKIEGKTDG